MAGTKLGALKAAATNKERHGEDFYKEIGKIGGVKSSTGGFGSKKVGSDGLTGKQRARIAGVKGGLKSRRGPAKAEEAIQEEELSSLVSTLELPEANSQGLQTQRPSRLQDVIRIFRKR